MGRGSGGGGVGAPSPGPWGPVPAPDLLCAPRLPPPRATETGGLHEQEAPAVCVLGAVEGAWQERSRRRAAPHSERQATWGAHACLKCVTARPSRDHPPGSAVPGGSQCVPHVPGAGDPCTQDTVVRPHEGCVWGGAVSDAAESFPCPSPYPQTPHPQGLSPARRPGRSLPSGRGVAPSEGPESLEGQPQPPAGAASPSRRGSRFSGRFSSQAGEPWGAIREKDASSPGPRDHVGLFNLSHQCLCHLRP